VNYKTKIKVCEHEIDTPKQDIRMLGCQVNNKLSPEGHIKKILNSGRIRIAMLKTLRNRGMPKNDLKRIYTALVRSIIEFGLAVYIPMINKVQMKSLERLQKMALRAIYGFHPYEEIIRVSELETMEKRMYSLFERFTESFSDSRIASERLGSRECSRNLRKIVGLQSIRCNTRLAQATPLNVIRASNSRTTPGRTNPKVDRSFFRFV
jgi:hypothetical protein